MLMYLDTAIIIYLLEEKEPFYSDVIKRLDKPDLLLQSSEIARLECRVKPIREGNDILLMIYDQFFEKQMDADEDLPWPNIELVQKWWCAHRQNFQSGLRYLAGQPISEEYRQNALREGMQRQRANAAIELAMLKPGSGLFNVKAPGFRRKKLLSFP